jgi:hypothetical protein
MYAVYREGKSLEDVGDAFGVSRQSVYERFRRQKLELRKRPAPLPFIEFDGHRYTADHHGYFRRTTGDGEALHRAKWMKANGPIARDHEVNFVDGDRMNVELENLICVPRDEANAFRSARGFKLKACIACGELMGRRFTATSREGPAAYAKRKTCNLQCSGEWKLGRRRGAKMNDVSLIPRPRQLRLALPRMANDRDAAAAAELEQLDKRYTSRARALE